MERSRSSLTALDEVRLRTERLQQFVEHKGPYTTFHDWHEIGSAGEPAFAGVWVNFDNAVIPERVAFWKNSAGMVLLRGLAKTGSGLIFTLPVGFRPLGTRRFSVDGNSAYARINIEADGDVILVVGAGTTSLSLDGISFRAEQ